MVMTVLQPAVCPLAKIFDTFGSWSRQLLGGSWPWVLLRTLLPGFLDCGGCR